jgi:hypothetical protein
VTVRWMPKEMSYYEKRVACRRVLQCMMPQRFQGNGLFAFGLFLFQKATPSPYLLVFFESWTFLEESFDPIARI